MAQEFRLLRDGDTEGEEAKARAGGGWGLWGGYASLSPKKGGGFLKRGMLGTVALKAFFFKERVA